MTTLQSLPWRRASSCRRNLSSGRKHELDADRAAASYRAGLALRGLDVPTIRDLLRYRRSRNNEHACRRAQKSHAKTKNVSLGSGYIKRALAMFERLMLPLRTLSRIPLIETNEMRFCISSLEMTWKRRSRRPMSRAYKKKSVTETGRAF